MADAKLEQLQNQEPIVFQINKIIQDEYEKLKAISKNYAELKRNCKKRSNEIAYRHAEIGRCVKKKFESCLERDLEELRCPSKET